MAAGSTKFAVPTATAVAPASMNSTASCALAMPPMPITGTRTASYTSHTMRRATGLIAGPDSPPTRRASTGRCVSTSIATFRRALSAFDVDVRLLAPVIGPATDDDFRAEFLDLMQSKTIDIVFGNVEEVKALYQCDFAGAVEAIAKEHEESLEVLP